MACLWCAHWDIPAVPACLAQGSSLTLSPRRGPTGIVMESTWSPNVTDRKGAYQSSWAPRCHGTGLHQGVTAQHRVITVLLQGTCQSSKALCKASGVMTAQHQCATAQHQGVAAPQVTYESRHQSTEVPHHQREHISHEKNTQYAEKHQMQHCEGW
jgi:hypothetical protein